ncbi:MAG TPA: hypothetical protein VFQ12_10100 [Thermoleophilaceae bacterium]|nr:hypothetical protein [Thermoleophilaceae bacterium]
MRRGGASVVWLVVGVTLVLAGGVSVYLSEEIADEGAFASRAVDALRDGSVRRVVAREVATQLAARSELLEVPRDELEEAVYRGIRTPTFERSFRAAAEATHAALFEGGGDRVAFDVTDAGSALLPALESVAPGLDDRFPVQVEARLLEIDGLSFGVRTLRVADDLRTVGPILLLAGLAALAAGVAIAPDRRRAATRAALGIGGAAALLVVLLVLFGDVVVEGVRGDYVLSGDDVGPAAEGVWSAYTGDLTTWALVLAGLGLGSGIASAWLARAP